jgi:hypothetical protein
MKSPFPGMDPYLEKYWGDVHHRLIQYSCDALQPKLPDDLRARVEERVYLESEPERARQFVPDVYVSEVRSAFSKSTPGSTDGGVALAEPIVLELHDLPITEGYIEIREKNGGKVVTVIEFLSPSNKSGGTGQEKYMEKQSEVLRSDASLVEIDLVRAGQHVLAFPRNRIPRSDGAQYLVSISPGWNRNRRELYRMPLREPLPVLPIPLREHESPVALNLQRLLDEAYSTGRYEETDYDVEIEPPLNPEDLRWISELLKVSRKTD